MDIVGIGTDIVECLRIGRMIEQHGELFLTRVYTEREIRYCQARKHAMEHFAGRWAAKEAVLKCLGTGWSRGVAWTDVEIRNDPQGKPQVMMFRREESMKTLWRCKWIGVGLLGSVLLMGCRHCRHHCKEEIICWDCTDCAPVKKAEAPPYTEGTVTIAPAAHSEPQVTEVKKVKRNHSLIQWT